MSDRRLYSDSSFAPFVYGSGPDWDDAAETYHEASKMYRLTAPAQRGPAAAVMDLVEDPDEFLGSPGVSRRGPTVALPAPQPPSLPLGHALARRRSQRDFSAEPLEPAEISTLLWATYGRGPRGRPCPSGGALYPLQIWLVAKNVTGLGGLYQFEPDLHALTAIDVARDSLEEHLAVPGLVTNPAAWVMVSGVFWRSRFKYGQRGYRHVLLEAGHAVQNLLLAAVALDVGAVSLSAFFDDETDRFVGVDGVDESVLYGAALGAMG